MASIEEKVEALRKEIPCRETQIDLLISLMGEGKHTTYPAIFVYGNTATAKTMVVRTILKSLKATFAFINCIEIYSQRILFETILTQLSKFSTGSMEDIGCFNMNDFVRSMTHVTSRTNLSENTIYIVLDKAERLRNMIGNILPAFLKLQELVEKKICVILLSELIWEKFQTGTIFCDPIPVHFPNYKRDELSEILSRDCPCEYPKDFYINYVTLILNVFYSVCRDLNELRYLCCTNFKFYCKPIESGLAQITDVKKLWRHFEPQLKTSLQNVYMRDVSNSHWEKLHSPLSDLSIQNVSTKDVLELPFYSKFLLIAAYLASYNPTKSDKRFFLKRAKIRKTVKNMKRNERLSNHMLGPKLFPLDRLLAIFYSIVEDRVTPSALLFSQISSLVSLHLISQCDTADILQTPKYKCLVTSDCIRSIAKTVNFTVERYLYDFI